MKPLLTLAAVFLIAVTAVAEDKPKEDSPLVAAAKRANRGKSTTIVITDEMVKKSTGHVTTTTVEYNPTVPEPGPQTSEMKMLEARAAQKAEAEKKAAEAKAAEEKKQQNLARRARLADSAENYEDGYDEAGADPAQVEKDLAETAKKQPKKP